VLTPTASSQIVAGVGLWSVIWSAVYKIQSLAKICHVERFVNRDRLLEWINTHRTVALIITELINFLWHGTDSGNAVLFAIGGTLTNIMMIMVVGPIRFMLRSRKLDTKGVFI
jgi:hypothetical protein